MKKKEIRIRCWIDVDGEKFFGPGPAQLLTLIGESGSITKAAKEMGMSYKKAWDMVSDLNTRSKKSFVIARKGGDKGGGAELTENAKKIVQRYKKLTLKLNTIVQKDKTLLELI